MNITIGTRGSQLALWQAHYIKKELEKQGNVVQLKIISTIGDRTQQWNTSFEKIEGKGFFTKELEEALLNKEIDLAVHSHKDLPTTHPEGLMIAAITERHDPSELLIIRNESYVHNAPLHVKTGAIIGTSSARRKTQVRTLRNDVELKDLRGNVPTRIEKLRAGQYDAILLAAAGVERLELNLSDLKHIKLNPTQFVPAPAQGALALQIRTNDLETFDALQFLHHESTCKRIGLERFILNQLDGGCQLPLGVYCYQNNDEYNIHVAHAHNINGAALHYSYTSPTIDAQHILSLLRLNTPKSVFISRNIKTNDVLKNALQGNGYKLSMQSLIKTQTLVLTQIPISDWIFFSSKNAVVHFFEQAKQISPTTKMAALGDATAQELYNYVNEIHFIGQGNNITETGKAFFNQVQTNHTVLFPQAKAGNRSIQQLAHNAEQIIDVIVYETLATPAVIAKHNIYVFTSPSNFTSYLINNTIDTNAKYIAIGENTAKALQQAGISYVKTPRDFSDIAMLEVIMS
ncbi:MAG: hydroxymethylbilane synthase [Bacteroidia bacterium]|nr:hydroxymethylbilane synthase [Bacteroidia bacterium]